MLLAHVVLLAMESFKIREHPQSKQQNEREKGLGSFSPILGVGRSSGQALCLLLLLFHLHFGRRVVLADDVFSSSTSFLEVGSVLL